MTENQKMQQQYKQPPKTVNRLMQQPPHKQLK